MLSAVILSALFFCVDVEAGRHSSKRSGSSQRGSSKRSGSNRRSKRSASSQRADASVADRDLAGKVQTTVTTGVSSNFYEELKTMITTLQGKVDSMDKRLETLVGRISSVSVATSTVSTTSSSASESTLTELGYLKGSADLCKPDSSGHKYCSVAINSGKASFKSYDDAGKNRDHRCLWYYFDKVSSIWRFSSDQITWKAENGKIWDMVAEFNSDKPDLYVVTDFSYYADKNENNRKILQGEEEDILICGKGLRYSGVKEYRLFDDTILRPFPIYTDTSGNLYWTDESNIPILKYSKDSKMLEYRPVGVKVQDMKKTG